MNLDDLPRSAGRIAALLLLAGAAAFPWDASAQEPEPGPTGERSPSAREIDGPPPPGPDATINRDETGNATVRAVRLEAPLVVDGVLDEALYGDVPPVSGFIQSIPDEGAAATEETEAWISYDGENIYVSARLHESAPEGEWVANELRRDTNQLRQNDTFGVMFDTFYDRRNGVMFYTNPLGALAEFAITNEGNPNSDWNPIWDVRTGRFPGGWTVEMAIPFQSLRYRAGTSQVWGLQLRRAIRRKNEWTYLTLVPRSASGTGAQGAFRVSVAGTLVGLEAPPGSLDLEIKPYGIAGVSTDRTVTPAVENDGTADAGVDLKYGITENLTADLTYNTDFAQVEVDEQQVNLTRFSLFFPEKREFFLEGSGIFDFASTPVGVGGGGGGPGSFRGGPTPTLFFSRRIGLQNRQPVPIIGGARVTGKVGAFDVGALSIQTDAPAVGVESTNFSVLRLRRDILRRSSVGALYARRSNSLQARAGFSGANETYGVDSSFSVYENVNFGGYYARTGTPGITSLDESYQGRASYDGDEWGIGTSRVVVGENFHPEVGFLTRSGFRQSNLTARFSPRPESIESIRQLTFQGTVDYFEDQVSGFVETRQRQGRFQAEFENSDQLSLRVTDTYENLEEDFPIHEDVTIPVGRYAFTDVEVSYSLGLQRPWSGNLSLQRGSFFDGDITTVGFTRGRIEVLRQFSVEPTLSYNRVDLPYGDFDAVLAVTRLNYSFSPRMFLSGLVQYNSSSDSFSTNARLRWEYAPGSEIFLVYTEDRDTDVFDRFSELSNRGLVIKVTRLFRY